MEMTSILEASCLKQTGPVNNSSTFRCEDFFWKVKGNSVLHLFQLCMFCT